jgi:hypothetical protein
MHSNTSGESMEMGVPNPFADETHFNTETENSVCALESSVDYDIPLKKRKEY